MELRFVKASPCRNTTVFICDDVPSERYGEVARLAMDADYLAAEQVGFLVSPRSSGAVLRLEMAGGEFCGNAALALAAWAVKCSVAPSRQSFLVECSGEEKPLACAVEEKASGKFFVQLEMPHAMAVAPLDLSADGQIFRGGQVTLPGISHFCFEAPEAPTHRQYDLLLDRIAEVSGAAAYGVVPYRRQGAASYMIRPYVGVAETSSRIYEQACGSGSLALGLWLEASDGGSHYEVVQPGGRITVAPKEPSIAAEVYFSCRGHLFVPDGMI